MIVKYNFMYFIVLCYKLVELLAIFQRELRFY